MENYDENTIPYIQNEENDAEIQVLERPARFLTNFETPRKSGKVFLY